MKIKPFKKDNKSKLVVLSICAFIVVGLIFIASSYSIKSSTTVDELLFSNLKVNNNGEFHATVNVSNKTGSDYNLKYINVIVINNGVEIKLPTYIGNVIKNNETKILDVKYNNELKDISEITYEVKR